MANKELKDRGSRKHLLDLVESPFRSSLNKLIARSGFRLAKKPHLQPYSRENADEWTEFEVEEYLGVRQDSRLPHIADGWWIPHKIGNNSRPTWDLIAQLHGEEDAPGILLVEAKANVTELNPKRSMSKSTGSRKSDANRKQIKRRIKETQRILNRLNRRRIKLPLRTHFQLVNRLAYSCHLASLGYKVVLLYPGFCKDTYFKDPILDDRHWQRIMGGYIEGVVSQSFPEIRHEFDSGGSLQMLIEVSEIESTSVR